MKFEVGIWKEQFVTWIRTIREEWISVMISLQNQNDTQLKIIYLYNFNLKKEGEEWDFTKEIFIVVHSQLGPSLSQVPLRYCINLVSLHKSRFNLL